MNMIGLVGPWKRLDAKHGSREICAVRELEYPSRQSLLESFTDILDHLTSVSFVNAVGGLAAFIMAKDWIKRGGGQP